MTAVPNTLNSAQRVTFKGNCKQTRYGWLRLTPAYSLHLVKELLAQHAENNSVVLDPFCGTGTTALACAERGLTCDTTDINPFLLWLTEAKARVYSNAELTAFSTAAVTVSRAIRNPKIEPAWLPPLYQIEKRWSGETLKALARSMGEINKLADSLPRSSVDLLKIAFCRTAIETADVSFGHQSMSFKQRDTSPTLDFPDFKEDMIAGNWEQAVASISGAAVSPIKVQPRVLLCDARNLLTALAPNRYDCVITSPPYPNRMSYIRELRPYLYWLGYLKDQRAAGELDWLAIGGTWGSATSNVGKWHPEVDIPIPFAGFNDILASVALKSPLLSRYIHKYFYDMHFHCGGLFKVVRPGGVINYIVGNSKFYDVLLPVEEIFAALFEFAGFGSLKVSKIRKRTSKKELFGFVVSARKPPASAS